MRYIQEIESPENVRILVIQDLKELGIKVPKAKKNKNKEESLTSSNHLVFGNFLNMVPCLMVEECGPVPKFLIQATQILDKHIDIEGLFRKSGSVARQKELKTRIESNEDVLDANPLDVASLIKQFFRELPDPLFTSRLHDTFLKCFSLETEDARITAILLLCHQLPWHHLSTLRYMMLFLQKVAHNCDLNKMDIANLAVCVTPNLMHNNISEKKSDKMTESKWLQIQTNIVQLLILYAGDIGMVPDSLYERSVLMSACFPTDDDLERSEVIPDDGQSKNNTKKKKKRSGSLQGLVNNLSNSFTKWRKENRGHNASSISDRSTMSYQSFDKSSMVSVDHIGMSQPTLPQGDEFLNPDATPKVIRKRKAEDEAVPFSASRKKAILQHMPQMATLGNTPFTPVARRGRYPRDFQETPSIKFADSENIIFNGGSTPSLVTPKRKMDKLFSPYSATKVKRQSSGKSGCFSPKTAKGSMRKSVRGFFRRLSGGKEPLPSPSGLSQSSIGENGCSKPDSLIIMDAAASQRKKTFFGRHRKTPSSPARLVTNIAAELKREKAAMASRGSSASSVRHKDQDLNGSFNSTELGGHSVCEILIDSPLVDPDKTPVIGCNRAHSSNLSMDSMGTSLRRGKPNTVKTGLPLEYHKRRSLDIDSFALHDDGGKDIESVANTLDTSPILKEHQNGSHCGNRTDLNDDTETTPKCIADNTDLRRHSSASSMLSRQLSKSSITSKLEESMNNPAELGLDQAFINESMMADVTQLGDGGDRCQLNYTDMMSPEAECQYTVKYSCVDVSVVQLDENAKNTGVSKNGKGDISSQHSVDSVDSAVGSDVGQEIYKSTASLQSCDSGLSLPISDCKTKHKQTAKSDSNLNSAPNKQVTGSDMQQCILSCRTSSEPNLGMCEDTQVVTSVEGHSLDNKLLSCVGDGQKLMRDSVINLHHTGKVSSGVHQFDDLDRREIEKRKESPHRFCNSPIRRMSTTPVKIPVVFSTVEQNAIHYRDIARLGTATRTGSIRRPKLPISTNLVRAKSVQHCKTQLDAASVDSDVSFAQHNATGTAGHTPSKPKPQATLRLVEIDSSSSNVKSIDAKHPLHENNRINMSSFDGMASTPKIKPRLFAADKGQLILNRPSTPAMTPNVRHCRMPVKPLKRLQASPVSPHNRRHSRSPRLQISSPCKTPAHVKKRGMSPLPTQDPDWNI